MKNFGLLIFDLDGTIVDSENDIASAVNYMRSLYGKPALDLSTVRSFIGSGVKLLVEQALDDLSANEQQAAALKLIEYYKRHLLDTTVIYPGMKQVIEQLQNRTKAVLSNKPEELSKKILKELNIGRHFAIIWGGDSLAKKKPDPEPILKIIEQLKFTKQDALMIGDGINDILAAKSAGIKCAAAGYGYTDLKDLSALNPDYLLLKPEDLIEIVVSYK